MSVQSALARGRAAAERLMTDTCLIRRRTGETTDPGSGVITPTYTTIYTGRCRLQQRASTASAQDAGEAYRLMQRLELHLPATVEDVRPDDEATITASTTDPDVVGRPLVVRDAAYGTHRTARRLGVTEATS